MRKFQVSVIILFLVISGLMYTGKASASSLIVNPNQVYSYTRMVSDIQKLKAAYPNLINIKVIGKSEYGRDLYAVSLGTGPAHVFINGAHHAREWLTTNLNMYMLNQYANAYMQNQKIGGYDVHSVLNASTIWFVPMVNPDGVTLQQQGLKAFPKSSWASLIKTNHGSTNFSDWKANGKGVDLNRQYDANWKYIHNSPKGPSYKDFKGTAPASAAETKALLKFVGEINPEMAVSYHTMGKILYWNFKQDKARYNRDKVYADQLHRMTGYKLVNPGPNPSGGGFTDWFIFVKKKPAFTLEIAYGPLESNPPVSQFPTTWKENQAVGLYVASESAKLYDTRTAASLLGQYQSLDASAKKLASYYLKADLKLDFTDLYNRVKTGRQTLGAQADKLPAAYRAKFTALQKDIDLYLTNSVNFINGVNAGEKLLAVEQSLNTRLMNGTLDSGTLDLQKQLSSQIQPASALVAKMYSSSIRSAASMKYILPAQITKENTANELSRYELILKIKATLAAGNVAAAKDEFAQLDQLEAETAAVKEKGNKLHPGKYYSFPNTEKWLADQKAALQAQLAALEAGNAGNSGTGGGAQ